MLATIALENLVSQRVAEKIGTVVERQEIASDGLPSLVYASDAIKLSIDTEYNTE